MHPWAATLKKEELFSQRQRERRMESALGSIDQMAPDSKGIRDSTPARPMECDAISQPTVSSGAAAEAGQPCLNHSRC